jgi:hypothetical protein
MSWRKSWIGCAIAGVLLAALLMNHPDEAGAKAPGGAAPQTQPPIDSLSLHQIAFDHLLVEFEESPLSASYRAAGGRAGLWNPQPRDEANSTSASGTISRAYERNSLDVIHFSRVDLAELTFEVLPRNEELNPRDITIDPKQLGVLRGFHTHYHAQLTRVADLLSSASRDAAHALVDAGHGDPIPELPAAQTEQENVRMEKLLLALRGARPPAREVDLEAMIAEAAKLTGTAPSAHAGELLTSDWRTFPPTTAGSVVVFRNGEMVMVDVLSSELVLGIIDYQTILVQEYVGLLTAFFVAQNALTISEAKHIYSRT